MKVIAARCTASAMLLRERALARCSALVLSNSDSDIGCPAASPSIDRTRQVVGRQSFSKSEKTSQILSGAQASCGSWWAPRALNEPFTTKTAI